MAWPLVCSMAAIILLTSTPICYSAVLQAAIEIDTGTDNLLDLLLKAYELNGKGHQTKKEASELSSMLLRLVPLVSVRGNITDKTQGVTINFQFQASTSTAITTTVQDSAIARQDVSSWQESREVFQPIVEIIQLYLVQILVLIIEGILGVIIARVIENSCLF